MNQKYIVELPEEEREEILKTLHTGRVAPTFRKRASILLLADTKQGVPAKQSEIAARCGVSVLTVANTVKSYAQTGLEATLQFKAREQAPNPPIITGEKEARILALACGDAPEGRTRWTLRLLAEKAVELQIIDSVSHSTIRATLKKHNLSLT